MNALTPRCYCHHTTPGTAAARCCWWISLPAPASTLATFGICWVSAVATFPRWPWVWTVGPPFPQAIWVLPVEVLGSFSLTSRLCWLWRWHCHNLKSWRRKEDLLTCLLSCGGREGKMLWKGSSKSASEAERTTFVQKPARASPGRASHDISSQPASQHAREDPDVSCKGTCSQACWRCAAAQRLPGLGEAQRDSLLCPHSPWDVTCPQNPCQGMFPCLWKLKAPWDCLLDNWGFYTSLTTPTSLPFTHT